LIGIVIPAHNEAGRVPQVLERLRMVDIGAPVLPAIVVDDGSTDGTAEAAEGAGAAVVRLSSNLGKGSALRAGVDEALRRGAGVVVMMDADGQHRPEDLPALVGPILTGEADVTLGARTFTGEMPRLYRFGNRLLSAAVAILFGMPVADSQCGLRAFTAAAARDLRWSSAGYAVETEMLVRMARARLRWREVPIPSLYLDRSKGTQASDGLLILWKLLRWRLLGLPPA
jgi:glycosyltransferase involved in cell wall biosynthesis